MSALASFTRLSPSSILVTFLGIVIFLKTAVAATASGGEMMAPNKKPMAMVKPGKSAFAINPMPNVVTNTMVNARIAMGFRFCLNSYQLVLNAAMYKIGGRNTSITIEGSRKSLGNDGMAPSSIPTIVSNTGKSTLIFAEITDKATTQINRIITISITGILPFFLISFHSASLPACLVLPGIPGQSYNRFQKLHRLLLHRTYYRHA